MACVFDADVNECNAGYNACHKCAKCVNTVGGYYCECKRGYRGNGRVCKKIERYEPGKRIVGMC